MKRVLMIASILSGISLCAPANAQSAGYDMPQLHHSVEARIGLTVPFGGDYKKVAGKPQLAFDLRSDGPRSNPQDWVLRANAEPRDFRKVKLALTLEPEPSFLLNDQVVRLGDNDLSPDGTLNALDTYDKTVLTVIGVSLAVIAGSIIIISDD